jgi:hypothetical protein
MIGTERCQVHLLQLLQARLLLRVRRLKFYPWTLGVRIQQILNASDYREAPERKLLKVHTRPAFTPQLPSRTHMATRRRCSCRIYIPRSYGVSESRRHAIQLPWTQATAH